MPVQIIITVLVIAVAGLLLLTTVVGNKTGSTQSTQPQGNKVVTPTGTPAPTAIQAGTVKGTIVSVTGDTLVVAEADGDKRVSIAGTSDFQKVLSGSIEGGTAVFATATRADLVVGKEVLIAIDEKTGTAFTVIVVN